MKNGIYETWIRPDGTVEKNIAMEVVTTAAAVTCPTAVQENKGIYERWILPDGKIKKDIRMSIVIAAARKTSTPH